MKTNKLFFLIIFCFTLFVGNYCFAQQKNQNAIQSIAQKRAEIFNKWLAAELDLNERETDSFYLDQARFPLLEERDKVR